MRNNRVWWMACLWMLVTAVQVNAQKKPNILVIFGDDVGYWNVSAYNRGMTGYKTPNILSHGRKPATRKPDGGRAAGRQLYDKPAIQTCGSSSIVDERIGDFALVYAPVKDERI